MRFGRILNDNQNRWLFMGNCILVWITFLLFPSKLFMLCLYSVYDVLERVFSPGMKPDFPAMTAKHKNTFIFGRVIRKSYWIIGFAFYAHAWFTALQRAIGISQKWHCVLFTVYSSRCNWKAWLIDRFISVNRRGKISLFLSTFFSGFLSFIFALTPLVFGALFLFSQHFAGLV